MENSLASETSGNKHLEGRGGVHGESWAAQKRTLILQNLSDLMV